MSGHGSSTARAQARNLGISFLAGWSDDAVLALASGRTGYDCGERFDSPEEVREYMQLETVGDLGDYCGPLDFTHRTGLHQIDLDQIAEVIIRTRSHCAF